METPTLTSEVAHDLRTPLNAIIGMADLLLEPYFGTLNERQREYLADIRGSGAELLALVNRLAGRGTKGESL